MSAAAPCRWPGHRAFDYEGEAGQLICGRCHPPVSREPTRTQVDCLSESEARSLTDEVKGDAQALWAKCLRLYEGEAHKALGYTSWGTYWEAEFGRSDADGYRVLQAARVVGQLPIGSPTLNEAQARELAPLVDNEAELIAVVRELHAEHGEALTAAKMGEAVSARLRRDRVVKSLTASGGSCEWYTPARYVEAAREVLGAIDLDPASSEAANETVKAERYFNAEDDGLSREWPGRVWLNPPYGGIGPRFIEKLLAQFEAGTTTAAVALLNSNTTDTRWFEPCFAHPICFACGRIDFEHPYEKPSTPTHGSLFVYLGPDGDRFARVFSAFGAVVIRHPACCERHLAAAVNSGGPR